MKKLIIFANICIYLFIGSFVFSQENTKQKYWIFFKDKGPDITEKMIFSKNSSLYNIAKSELTERALQRRSKSLPEDNLVDYGDFPIHQRYLENLSKIGIKIENKIKWFNAITAYLSEIEINNIKNLDFVKGVEPVITFKRKDEEPIIRETKVDKVMNPQLQHKLKYGQSLFQNEFMNVPKVHDIGINGKNVLVGMLDTGFRWRTHNSLSTRNVIKEYDFVFRDTVTANESIDRSDQDSHGTLTFSNLAGYSIDTLIGPAYNSTFILAKTEDIRSETKVEEDNWVAAIEWMEGYGVDLTSTSLGYNEFDNSLSSYTYKDMDGNTSRITKAADIAFTKGVVVLNSAGNEASKPWKYIIAPADGKYVIAVGAANRDSTKAYFSSIGPTSDGRIKPDISTYGVSVYGATAGIPNGYGYASGTSCACPLAGGVAALVLSARPDLTPTQVRDALRNTASQANKPDNLLGWGIIDAYKAVTYNGLVFSNEPEIIKTSNSLNLSIYLASIYKINKESVKLFYALNNATTYTELPMNQDSLIDYTNSGRYKASIPTSGAQTITYYFSASDSLGERKHPYTSPLKPIITFIYNFGNYVVPTQYFLYQNYPNPFNPNTTIKYQIPKYGYVSLKIFDILGKEVTTLTDKYQSAGNYEINFNASKYASGVYFYKLSVSEIKDAQSNGNLFEETKKLLLVR